MPSEAKGLTQDALRDLYLAQDIGSYLPCLMADGQMGTLLWLGVAFEAAPFGFQVPGDPTIWWRSASQISQGADGTLFEFVQTRRHWKHVH